MHPREAERCIDEMQEAMQKHQQTFKEQTRIDSVDVIVRRKDKKLEPLEP